MVKSSGRRASWLHSASVTSLACLVSLVPVISRESPSSATSKMEDWMDGTIIFQPETATLPPISLYLLKVMAHHFVRTSGRRLLITAHSEMSQPEAESVALSQQRADAVANTLAVDGVDRSRMIVEWRGRGTVAHGDIANCDNRATVEEWSAVAPQLLISARDGHESGSRNC